MALCNAHEDREIELWPRRESRSECAKWRIDESCDRRGYEIRRAGAHTPPYREVDGFERSARGPLRFRCEKESLCIGEGEDVVGIGFDVVGEADWFRGVQQHVFEFASSIVRHSRSGGPVEEVVTLREGFGQCYGQTGIRNQGLPFGDGE